MADGIRLSEREGQPAPVHREEFWWASLGKRHETGDSVLVSWLGHKVLLQQAGEALHNALTAIDDTQSAECVALELRVALQALGEIVGIVTNEDILDQIFREFCIGK